MNLGAINDIDFTMTRATSSPESESQRAGGMMCNEIKKSDTIFIFSLLGRFTIKYGVAFHWKKFKLKRVKRE